MKKGFTLIELLAVIVILAVIALITVPIVQNTINNSEKNSYLISGKNYVRAVDLSISNATLEGQNIPNGTYNILENGNICLSYDTNNNCINELKTDAKGETPKEGTVTIFNGEVSYADMLIDEQRLIQNSKGVVTNFPCVLISGEPKAIGSKYECEVSPGTKYNFYVLSYNDADNKSTNDKTLAATINLILDRNVNSDGTLTTEALTKPNAKNGVYNTVEWVSKDDYDDDTNFGEFGNHNKGPITAMNFLYNATKDWTNIPNIQMNYEDEGKTGSYGYGKIITTDNVTKITKKDGSAVTVLTDKEGYMNLKARMPYKREISNYDHATKANAFLYDYLELSGDIQVNMISGISGYWTFSSYGNYFSEVVFVGFSGSTIGGSSCTNTVFGVRPVINIKL